jgi:hypothetical protein
VARRYLEIKTLPLQLCLIGFYGGSVLTPNDDPGRIRGLLGAAESHQLGEGGGEVLRIGPRDKYERESQRASEHDSRVKLKALDRRKQKKEMRR